MLFIKQLVLHASVILFTGDVYAQRLSSDFSDERIASFSVAKHEAPDGIIFSENESKPASPSAVYTWTGTTSDDYNTGSNWDLGTVPGAADDIIISTAAINPCSINSGSFTVTNITINSTGDFRVAAGASLIVTNNVSYSSSVAPSLNCSSTINFGKAGALTIPAWNYGNLTCAGGTVRTWSVGTTGICGTFTPGVGTTYVATVGSTVDYTNTLAQTIQNVNYYNLSNSGNGPRSYNNLSVGTIDIANIFTPTTGIVTTGSLNTINFSSAGAQTIPTTTYFNLNNAGTGPRTLATTGANSNKITIGNFFGLPTGALTTTGSTVEFTGPNVYLLAGITYHNLIFNSSGTGLFSLASGTTLTVTGNLTITATGSYSALNIGSINAVSTNLNVLGNVDIQNKGILQMVTNATSFGGNANISGNLTVSGTGKINLEPVASVTAAGIINVAGDFISTGTSVAVAGVGGIVDWGVTGSLINNGIYIKGNFNHSGTGTFGASTTSAATPALGFVFNNTSGTQTFTYTGAAVSSKTNYQVNASARLQLLTGLTLGAGASPFSNFTISGTLDCVNQVITAADANSTFTINNNAILRTEHVDGVTGSLAGFSAGKITGNSGIYQFAGSAPQNTGFPSGVTAANRLDWLGTTALTLNQSFDINNPGNINFTNNGFFYIGNNNLSIGSGSAINGAPFSTGKMFVTNGTGHLIRNYTSAGAGIPFTWPIGDTTGIIEYTPVTVNSISTSTAGSFGFGVTDDVHPNISPVTSYTSRYWNYYTSGGTFSWGNAAFTYTSDDIVNGPEGLFRGSNWDGGSSSWTVHNSSSAASNILTISSGPSSVNLFNGNDITARAAGPVYYRSAAAGPNDWSNITSWQVSTDPLFVSPAPVTPLYEPNATNSGGITIRSGHTINLNSTATADELTIAAAGILNINSGALLDVNDGTGTDVSINGTLNNNTGGTITTNAGSLVSVLSGGYFKNSADINAAGSIDVTGTFEHALDGYTIPTATWNAGSLCYITGTTTTAPVGLGQNFYDLTWDCNQSGDINLANAITGPIQNDFTVAKTNGFDVRLASTENVSLSIGRDLRITGGTLIMNGASSSFAVPSSSLSVARDLAISGTGSFYNTNEYASGAGVPAVNVAGDINITGSAGQRLIIAGAKTGFATSPSSAVINLTGDFSLTGTGTMTVSESSASGTLFVAGNFIHSNGVIERNAGNADIVFNGTTPQFYTSGGTITTAVDFTVNTNAILDMNTSFISGTGTFTMQNNSTLRMGSPDGIVAASITLGNLRNSGVRTLPPLASYIYNGIVSQNTGSGLPNNITGSLTIDNAGTSPADVVTLTTDNTLTSTLNLNAGRFNAGTAGTLLITAGGSVIGNGGNQYLSGTANDNIIRFTANGSVQGVPELYNVTIGNSGSGVDFINNARVNGVLLINNLGLVSPNAPKYAIGSQLIYNAGVAYTRNNEWDNNTSGAAGYPYHVIVKNGTTLNFTATTPSPIGCAGDVTVGNPSGADAGIFNLTTVGATPLNIGGSLIIGGAMSAGAINMSNTAGGDIYIGKDWTRSATGVVNFGAGGRAVIFNGSNNGIITADGGQVFPYVYIDKSAKASKVTLADNVSITDEIGFTQGTVDLGTNNKFLTIISTATKTARVGQSSLTNTDFIYGTSDNSGQFIVQRYVPDRRSWRLVNAPLKPGGGSHTIAQAWQERSTGLDYTAASWAASVATDTITAGYGTQITGGVTADGFDISPLNNPSIKYFSGGSWYAPANTNATSVNSREGWLLFVRGDRINFGEITNQYKAPTITTLRPRGQIFIGPKSVTSSGITTVGNPYASAVDYNSMNRTGGGWPAQPTYYIWDPMLGGSQGVGAFVALTWNGTNFTRSAPLTGTGTSSYDNRYIPSGAAIMVDFPAGGGTLAIDETDKSTASTTTAFRPRLPLYQLMTVLKTVNDDSTTFVSDAALSLFDNSFNDAADINDVRKLSNVNENFAVQRNGSILAIERKKIPALADTIFYFMNRMQQKNYQLEFVMEHSASVPKKSYAFLEDKYLGKKTPVNLTGTTLVNFSVNQDTGSYSKNRFMLVFRRGQAHTVTNVHAKTVKEESLVNWSTQNEEEVSYYEVEKSTDGINSYTLVSKVLPATLQKETNYSVLDGRPNTNQQYYRIKIVGKDGNTTYSDKVKIMPENYSGCLSVYPNPVVNGAIQLKLFKSEAGIYTANLMGENGQIINTEIINHVGGNSVKTIRLKQYVASGAYRLQVIAPSGKVTIVQIQIIN